MFLRRICRGFYRYKSTSSLSKIKESLSSLSPTKETFILTDDQVRKYYKYFKIVDYSISASEENKLNDARRKWDQKSLVARLTIRNAIENIIYDLYKNHTSSSSTTIDVKQEDDNIDKIIRPNKTPLFRDHWINIHLGFYGEKKTKNFRIPGLLTTTVQCYFIYKQIHNLSIQGIEKLKKIDELSNRWKELSIEEKEKWRNEYADLELKGYRMNNYNLVKLSNDNVQKRRSPQGINSTRISTFKRIIIQHHLTTGQFIIDGIHLNDAANYFIWQQLNQGYENELYLYQRFIKLIEKWNKMSKIQQKDYQDKYFNCLKNGKILIYGEFQNITADIFRNNDIPYIKYCPVWGDIHGLKSRKREMPPLQILRNQTAGNYIPALPIGYNYVREYYVGKQVKSMGMDQIDSLYEKWDKNLTINEKDALREEYRQLIIQGKDLLNGEIVTIEEKLYQSNENYKIYEILGQGISKSKHNPSLSRKARISPVIYDYKTSKGIIVEDITLDMVFNYYLGLQFKTIPNIDQIFQDWISMTDEEQKIITDEYKNLLINGKDMLYGEIVPLSDKQEAHKKLTTVIGRGLPLEFYKDTPEEEILDDKDIFEYFKYYRSLENVKLQEIKSEWNELNQDDKNEIKDAYELLLLSGKAIERGKLVDIENM